MERPLGEKGTVGLSRAGTHFFYATELPQNPPFKKVVREAPFLSRLFPLDGPTPLM